MSFGAKEIEIVTKIMIMKVVIGFTNLILLERKNYL